MAARGRVDHREPDWHWGPWLGHVTWRGTEAAPLCPVGLPSGPSAKPHVSWTVSVASKDAQGGADTEDRSRGKKGGREVKGLSSTCGPRGCGWREGGAQAHKLLDPGRHTGPSAGGSKAAPSASR